MVNLNYSNTLRIMISFLMLSSSLNYALGADKASKQTEDSSKKRQNDAKDDDAQNKKYKQDCDPKVVYHQIEQQLAKSGSIDACIIYILAEYGASVMNARFLDELLEYCISENKSEENNNVVMYSASALIQNTLSGSIVKIMTKIMAKTNGNDESAITKAFLEDEDAQKWNAFVSTFVQRNNIDSIIKYGYDKLGFKALSRYDREAGDGSIDYIINIDKESVKRRKVSSIKAPVQVIDVIVSLMVVYLTMHGCIEEDLLNDSDIGSFISDILKARNMMNAQAAQGGK